MTTAATGRILCSKCGKDEVIIYSDEESAVCPECCLEHDYEYQRDMHGWSCMHCGAAAPDDYGVPDD